MSSEFDAAVIGSGPNGLCAAIALARAGLRVVVYEARDTVGGGLRTAELTLPGFRHDICSAIHPMAVGAPFLSSLPLEAHGLRWVHPEAPLAHPMASGEVVVQERSLGATARGLRDARYAGRYRPFVEGWAQLMADTMGPLGIPSDPVLMARFGLQAFQSARRHARRNFDSEAGQAYFAGMAAHSVLELTDVPSAAIGLMLMLAGHAVGWPFPQGGAQALADALASYLESIGGTIRTGTPITELGQVETQGPVFFSTSPQALCDIAGDEIPDGYRRQIGRYVYGPGSFKVDYALDGPIPWRNPEVARAATVHIGGSLEEIVASERAPWRGQHAERPFCILAQHSLFDATRAPEGKHTAWVYCHVPHGSSEDRQQAIEDQLERYAPGFRDLVLARHVSTSADLERYNANYIGGDVNGGAPILSQLFTRPVVRLNPYATPNPRLFLCSASTPPGGGVHGMAGFHAVRLSGALPRRGLLSG